MRGKVIDVILFLPGVALLTAGFLTALIDGRDAPDLGAVGAGLVTLGWLFRDWRRKN